jgi:leucyl aminopeptidase (aminopeptidase T)
MIQESVESVAPFSCNAFLEELEAQVAVERAKDPEGMAALEAQWAAKIEALQRANAKRYAEDAQRTRELGRLRVARYRARKKAKENALHKRQEIESFVKSWKRLSDQQQEEFADVFNLILDCMVEEIQALEEESVIVKKRSRRHAMPVVKR